MYIGYCFPYHLFQGNLHNYNYFTRVQRICLNYLMKFCMFQSHTIFIIYYACIIYMLRIWTRSCCLQVCSQMCYKLGITVVRKNYLKFKTDLCAWKLLILRHFLKKYMKGAWKNHSILKLQSEFPNFLRACATVE